MLDFAIKAGKTASAGVINSLPTNCSHKANILYGVHATKNAYTEKKRRKSLTYESSVFPK